MNQDKVKIGERIVGDGERCFLVAEAGTTCNGEVDVAKELVDAALEGGFDAIKFQTIWPEQLSDRNKVYRYRTENGLEEENMYEMFKKLTFQPDEWKSLSVYAKKKGITFFSSVDYPDGVDILEKCEVPIHKIGAWDITYEPLLVKISKTKKPLIVDLGPASKSDIDRLFEISKENSGGNILLMHEFHTDNPIEMNMRSIPYLKSAYSVPVGFSSPNTGKDLDIMSIALGANVIEKRITLNRKHNAHHHIMSLEPKEIKPWVDSIRDAEDSLGTESISPSNADIDYSKEYFRSICTLRKVKKGEAFTKENLGGKRPGTGLPTRHLEDFLSKKAARHLNQDILLDWNDVAQD